MVLAALPLISAVSLLASPNDFPAELCVRWTQALKAARHDDEVTTRFIELEMKAWRDAKVPDDWKDQWPQLWQWNPYDHLAFLRGAAHEHGATFDCPAYEFPFGKPTGEPLVGPEGGVAALAADESGPWWLSCYQDQKSFRNLCDLVHHDGAVKTVAAGLPTSTRDTRLIFDGANVLVPFEKVLVSVPKAGGAPKTLAKLPDEAQAFMLEGDTLWFSAGHSIFRVPKSGGEPAKVFEGPVKEQGSSSIDALLVSKGRVYFTAWQGHVYSLKDGAATPVGDTTQFEPVAMGGALWMLSENSLSKLDPATGKLTSAAPLQNWSYPVASNGELLGLASNDWPGRDQLLRYKPGAKAVDVLVRHIGGARQVAGNSKHVYWYDRVHGQLMSAPRPP